MHLSRNIMKPRASARSTDTRRRDITIANRGAPQIVTQRPTAPPRNCRGKPAGRWVATWAGVGLALVAMPVAAQTQAPASVTVVEPGELIQTAINSSQPGTHIRVKAGTYAEQLVITKDRIWLDGEAGARLVPPSTLVANGCTGMVVLGRVATAPPAHVGICVIGNVTFGAWNAEFLHKPVTETKRAVTGVTISGLDVEGFSVGIALAGTPHAIIERTRVVSGGPFAIVTSAAPDSAIRGNTLFNPTDNVAVIGVCLEGSDRSSLTRNDISGFINGICLASSHAVIAGNRLVDNHFGLYIDPGIEDIEVRHNLIDRNNRVEARAPQLRTGTGIMIEGARDVRAFGNMITNNTADNLANGIPLGAAGIIVRDSSPTVLASNISVRFNTITGNGLSADGVVYPGGSDVINIATGSSVAIEYNVCGTSRPAALC